MFWGIALGQRVDMRGGFARFPPLSAPLWLEDFKAEIAL